MFLPHVFVLLRYPWRNCWCDTTNGWQCKFVVDVTSWFETCFLLESHFFNREKSCSMFAGYNFKMICIYDNHLLIAFICICQLFWRLYFDNSMVFCYIFHFKYIIYWDLNIFPIHTYLLRSHYFQMYVILQRVLENNEISISIQG
jgi:hypothetical protein